MTAEIQQWTSVHGIQTTTDGAVIVKSYGPLLTLGLPNETTHTVYHRTKPDELRTVGDMTYHGTDPQELMSAAYQLIEENQPPC